VTLQLLKISALLAAIYVIAGALLHNWVLPETAPMTPSCLRQERKS
jgi:hypothetical protein